MSQIYNPSGTVGSTLKEATDAEAASGTGGQTYLRDNIRVTGDKIRYLSDAGQMKFPATPVPSADVNTVDEYIEYTAASAACTGAILTAAIWKLTKHGNVVTLTLPLVQGAGVATTNFAFGTAIPAAYRPSANMGWPTLVTDNAADLTTPGKLVVTASTGVINVYKNLNAAGNFTVTATAGLASATSVSWTI